MSSSDLPVYGPDDDIPLETEAEENPHHCKEGDEYHEHQTTLAEEGDYGFLVRWCVYCGTLFRYVGDGKYAELVPEWSQAALEAKDRTKEIWKKLPTTAPLRVRSKTPRLGRGLRELMQAAKDTPKPAFLNQLMGKPKP